MSAGKTKVGADGRQELANKLTDTTAIAPPPHERDECRRTDAREFIGQLSAGNQEILTNEEQGLVNALQVLVAGCGSVGGAAVEPLVRVGVGGLVLADPDTYELNNLNRQACKADDVGRAKVTVLADLARSINPYIAVETLPEGITPANVEEAVTAATIIYEAIDPNPGPLWMKYLLHKHAARHRVPVITGVDLAGQPTIYVFDYRRDNRPFLGKANVAAFREGRMFEAMLPWIGLRNCPSDFIPLALSRITTDDFGGPRAPGDRKHGQETRWPQVSYTAAALGALATRTVIDVAQGRSVPRVLRTDLHMLTRSRRDRISRQVRRPLELAQAARRLQQLRPHLERHSRAAAGDLATAAVSARLGELPAPTLAALEAMRLAPSGHNAQPWQLTLRGDDTMGVGYEPTRHPIISDPERRYICHALGCAIEAASTIAETEFRHSASDGDLFSSGWQAGDLTVGSIKGHDYGRSMGLLQARGTNRFPFATQAVSGQVLRRFEAIGDGHDVQVYTMTDKLMMRKYATIVGQAAMAHMADVAYMDELLEWIRFSNDEPDFEELGFTPEALGFGSLEQRLLLSMKRTVGVRRALMAANLPALMARQHLGSLAPRSGGLIFLTMRSSGPRAWIDGGRALMAIWLEATRAGLAMQPMSWPLDFEQTSAAVVALFRASQSEHPVIVARVGRPTAPTPRSLRLPLERIVELGSAA